MAAIITRRLAKESFKNLRFSVSSLRKLESKSHIHTKSILVPCRTHLRKFHLKRYFHSTPVFQGEIVSFKLSDIGEGIREVNVKDWFVSVGDHVTQFQSICEVQSDKASVTITSRYDGKITKIYYEVDDIALVGQPLVDIELNGDESGSQQDSHVDEQYSSSDSSDDDHFAEKSKGEKVLTTPAVRKIAKENKVKLSDVKGTGRDGRILKEDVLRYVQAKTKGPEKAAAQPSKPPVQEIKTPPPPPPKTVPVIKPQVAIGEDRTEKIKGIRKSMVKTMTEAHSIPVFGYDDEYDVSELVNFKDHVKDVTLASGVKFTYMPVIIKAVSLALSQYPILNSSVDATCENIIYKAAHNISIAMDTADGLLVPNVKNVQSLSIMDIAAELNRLQSLGNAGKLGTSELTGGTFSLSNIGAIGGTYARPVILPPNVAIGALGKFQALPRFDKDGNIKKVHILNVSWSADHRIIEGACMARFSNVLKAYLENPLSMLLYLR